MSTTTIVVIARTILVAWAGWWTFFSVGEAVSEPLEALVNHGWMVALMWLAVYLAWTRPTPAGWFLLALGAIGTTLLLASWFSNPHPSTWFVIATLSLPPIIAGLLLLMGGGRKLASGA